MGDNKSEHQVIENEVEKPDGGWGWIVVGAVAFINMFNHSFLFVFGLLFGDHLKEMNQETTGAAIVTNLNAVIFNSIGIFTGPIAKTFSPRKVAITGCLLTSSGIMLCAISTKFWHVICGYSILFGIGLGLLHPATFIIINSYFSKKRGRAVGFSLAGNNFGQITVPHISRYLLDNYGFATATFVLGFLSLSGVFAALLFRPLKSNKNKEKVLKEMKPLTDNNENDEIKEKNEIEDENVKKSENSICKKIFKPIMNIMDLDLLKDPVFINIIIGIGLSYTAVQNFNMLFPYFLQYSAGLTRDSTAYCMSALALADIMLRLTLPSITDKYKVPYRYTFFIGTIFLFIGRAIIAESTGFTQLIMMSAVYGAAKSATVLNLQLTIAAHCQPEKLPGGLGLHMIVKGIAMITLGPLLGWIRDYTGSYPLSLHAQNLLLGIMILMWSLELVYRKRF